MIKLRPICFVLLFKLRSYSAVILYTIVSSMYDVHVPSPLPFKRQPILYKRLPKLRYGRRAHSMKSQNLFLAAGSQLFQILDSVILQRSSRRTCKDGKESGFRFLYFFTNGTGRAITLFYIGVTFVANLHISIRSHDITSIL